MGGRWSNEAERVDFFDADQMTMIFSACGMKIWYYSLDMNGELEPGTFRAYIEDAVNNEGYDEHDYIFSVEDGDSVVFYLELTDANDGTLMHTDRNWLNPEYDPCYIERLSKTKLLSIVIGALEQYLDQRDNNPRFCCPDTQNIHFTPRREGERNGKDFL